MKILDDIISTLDFNTHIKDIRLGMFHTAVLSRRCGLAASLPRDALKQKSPMVKEPGSLLDRTPDQLVSMVHSESILEAAIGMAALNSLLEVDEEKCIELNAAELILEKGEGMGIAVIGHFPFLSRVREKAKDLWIIEKNPREGDLEEAEAGNFIPRADVVAITGTSLTNHTAEKLLALCRPDAFVVMLGDTTPISPILFDYGIDAVSGTIVINPELAMQCVSQGANFRQIKGTRRLTMMR